MVARPPGPDGSSPKRALPDYHRPAPKTAGDTLLWVPRVALFPVYFVTEYAVRQPLGALLRVAEKGNWNPRRSAICSPSGRTTTSA